MSIIYFAGNEDIDFYFSGNISVSGANFRPGFSRCSIDVAGGTVFDYVTNKKPFSVSSNPFWASARLGQTSPGGLTNTEQFKLADINRVTRIRMRLTNNTNAPQTFAVEKVTAANVATTLFTGSFVYDTVATGTEASQFSWHVQYAVAGFCELYYKGILLGTFTGDVTTDSITDLAYIVLGNNANGPRNFWSEVMVTDFDNRTCSLQTFAPVANGNTHNFDTGTPAAANVNEQILNVSTLDGSTTAGQIDEYTTAAVAAGTFDVMAYGVSVYASKGTSGPSKMDLAVRTGGSDFFSSDQALSTFYDVYPNWWTTNPNTSAAWLTNQIGSTSGFNIGIKSVT